MLIKNNEIITLFILISSLYLQLFLKYLIFAWLFFCCWFCFFFCFNLKFWILPGKKTPFSFTPLQKAWEILGVSFWVYPKAKDVIPDKQLGPYALGEIINLVILYLKKLRGDALWCHILHVRLHTQYLQCFGIKEPSNCLTHSWNTHLQFFFSV